MPRLKSYLFSFGDSTKGPVSFSARIQARSKEEALKELKEFIGNGLFDEYEIRGILPDCFEYLTVYFNSDSFTVKDIVEYEEILPGYEYECVTRGETRLLPTSTPGT